MYTAINTTKSLIVSRPRTVNPPHDDLVLSGVSTSSSPSLYILSVKFDSKLIFKDQLRGIVSRVSQRIDILILVKRVFVYNLCVTSLLLRICSPNPGVYSSPVWGSAVECHFQLLERRVYSVANLCLT